MAITHKYTLVCDEVRQEINLKWIILGLYTSSICVSQIPFVTPAVTFFMCLEADRPEQRTFRIRFSHLETGQVVAQGMGMMNIQAPGLGINVVRFPNVLFPQAGTYSFEMNIENEAPILVNVDVVLTPQRVQGLMGPQTPNTR